MSDAGRHAMMPSMPIASRIGLSLAGLCVVAAGTVLWVRFGGLVYFDMLAASFIGCLF